MRIAVIRDNGINRVARLDNLTDDQQEALLIQAVALHDFSGPEPVSEIAGEARRRGRPDPAAKPIRTKIREEIEGRRRKPPGEEGKPRGRSGSRSK